MLGINMTTYTNNAMVKKEHVKIISEELSNIGSRMPQDLDPEKDHCLKNILYLATGNGTYGLSTDQINQIGNDEFSIEWK